MDARAAAENRAVATEDRLRGLMVSAAALKGEVTKAQGLAATACDDAADCQGLAAALAEAVEEKVAKLMTGVDVVAKKAERDLKALLAKLEAAQAKVAASAGDAAAATARADTAEARLAEVEDELKQAQAAAEKAAAEVAAGKAAVAGLEKEKVKRKEKRREERGG